MSRSELTSRLVGLLLRQQASLLSGSQAASSTAASGLRFKSALAEPVAESVPHEKDGKVFHPELMNESVLKTQYAVRGELYLRAEELRKAGKEIIFTNGACVWLPLRCCSAACADPRLGRRVVGSHNCCQTSSDQSR